MDLFVIGIDHYYDNEAVLDFDEEYNIHFPSVSGTEGGGSQVFNDYNIPYTPATVLIAPDHTIVEQGIPLPRAAQEIIDLLETYEISVSGLGDELVSSPFNFSISPNPVSNTMHIMADEGHIIEQIKLYDLTGKELPLVSDSQTEFSSQLDVSYLKKGMYFVFVEFEQGRRITKTFVKL